MSNLDRELATSIYREFKSLPQSQRIASGFALYHLASLLSAQKIQSVLEIGAGIGTITRLLLVHPARPRRIVSTENHPICLAELEKNLSGQDKDGWSLVGSYDEIAPGKSFDLVIFDGLVRFDWLSTILKDGMWIFVEGTRKDTRIELANLLRQKGLNIVFENHLPGGMKLYSRKIRSLFGLPIPWLKRRKGCHVGRCSAI